MLRRELLKWYRCSQGWRGWVAVQGCKPQWDGRHVRWQSQCEKTEEKGWHAWPESGFQDFCGGALLTEDRIQDLTTRGSNRSEEEMLVRKSWSLLAKYLWTYRLRNTCKHMSDTPKHKLQTYMQTYMQIATRTDGHTLIHGFQTQCKSSPHLPPSIQNAGTHMDTGHAHIQTWKTWTETHNHVTQTHTPYTYTP